MDIRLVAVDLDGTLLDDDKRIPDGFFAAVEKLYRRGVRMVIASGRQYYNLLKHFEPVAEKLVFISDNGALVFLDGRMVYRREIPGEDLVEVFKLAETIPTAFPVVCGVGSVYFGACDRSVLDNISLYYEKRTVCDAPFDFCSGVDSIVKLAVFDREDAAANCLKLLKPAASRLAVTPAGPLWLDFMAPGTSKGAAISWLLDHLGLTAGNAMAFGDYMNDLEMLRSVGFGYAMANGHPELLAAAEFTAPCNNDNGVMRVLRGYFPEI